MIVRISKESGGLCCKESILRQITNVSAMGYCSLVPATQFIRRNQGIELPFIGEISHSELTHVIWTFYFCVSLSHVAAQVYKV